MALLKPTGRGAAATLLLSALLAHGAHAAETPTEAEVMAAFLYKFAHFVEWPDSVLPQGERLIVGVLGPDPFGEVLDRTVAGKLVRGRPIAVRRFPAAASPAEVAAAGCHILFVSPGFADPGQRLIPRLGNRPTLTVGESSDFATSGGMINFVREANRIRFQINQDASLRAGLQMSSQLLQLATIVSGPLPSVR